MAIVALEIVVADDEMFAAVESGEELGDALGIFRVGEIAKVIDLVFAPDRGVPAGDQHLVLFGNGGERALVDLDAARLAEMRIAREENRHGFSVCAARQRQTEDINSQSRIWFSADARPVITR